MAKYMTIEVRKEDMRETAKAYGFPYAKAGSWMQDSSQIVWLPKNQITLTDVTYDMYKEECGEFEANTLWQEGYVWVDVPMWLARKYNYFERCIFHA